MELRGLRLGALLCLAWAIGPNGVALADSPAVDYAREVQPILARNCLVCHGPDEEAREADLRLDERDAVLRELASGTTPIVPRDPARSEVFVRITTDDDSLRMPPEGSGHSLKQAEIDLIRRWIKEGANYSSHWAFKPLVRPELPAVRDAAWPRGAIDRFILNRLEAEGLSPSPEADATTLIRRLSLDLTGLPPSPEEIDAFLNDDAPNAYERLVDRLLASPHFGERWGRHWLDLARYADSDGYLGDDLRPYAYRYRDWVISAINNDVPFDRFTIEQLAGDLLDDASPEQRIATGFQRNAMKNTEAGFDKEADRVIRTVDRVGTMGTVWLGLTVACAECHSHKYDPISQREFYSLYAFFDGLQDLDVEVPLVGGNRMMGAPDTEDLQQVETLLRAAVAPAGPAADPGPYLRLLAMASESRTDDDREQLQAWLQDLDAESRKLATQYELLSNQRRAMTSIKAPTVAAAKAPRTTHIHMRGDFRRPGEEVEAGTPAFLPPLVTSSDPATRLDLARWLVDGRNPLPPRTAVNHLWKHLFGRGIVDTEENLGISGSTPSHPELLEWLAVELIERGWSRKAIIREIVTSAAYRQSSNIRGEQFARDPQNTLLARQSRWRVEAEIVRDLALASSGLLSRTVGGPSILPPLTSRITAVSRNQEWKVTEGAARYRRGMYILFRRATPYPMLTLFDAPDSTTACTARERSNSPLQALMLLNDPVFIECAQHFGRELSRRGDVPPEDWIAAAFRQSLGRSPEPAELDRLIAFYREQQYLIGSMPPEEISQLVGDRAVDVDVHEQAARVLVARSLMNLDEFVTRE